ncbi:hypothetical protein RhiirA5_385157 [Rhizophagus irregularis]|uniref:HAT C-terminal dimerisation domain-containing protein n=1 Tax=Rhizophagus irregularis TaxID=588596 RepID=A0A2N0NQ76_9GLOM|nr:hypothetical protein RhiirA5_385157 [Rhizophagus irregularis]
MEHRGEKDYCVFRHQSIAIFNKRYAEFADLLYLLSFFLHPGYKEICWTRGTFRNLLMTADEIFKKMGRSNYARKELMHQMKLFCKCEKPFDVELGDTEFLTTWWISIEDSFPEGEDYLVQLALKLLSITPHVAGCERVWSNLGWLYGKRRNRLGLNKIESMHKLSAYYHAHAKQELPYYGIGNTNEEIRNILVDAHLNPGDDLIEVIDDDYESDDIEARIFDEEDDLIISRELNLDANAFIKDLDEIIEDSDNIDMEEENIQDIL